MYVVTYHRFAMKEEFPIPNALTHESVSKVLSIFKVVLSWDCRSWARLDPDESHRPTSSHGGTWQSPCLSGLGRKECCGWASALEQERPDRRKCAASSKPRALSLEALT